MNFVTIFSYSLEETRQNSNVINIPFSSYNLINSNQFLDIKPNYMDHENSTEMQDMEGSALATEDGSLSKESSKAFDDPYGEMLLATYKGLNLDESSSLKTIVLVAPVGLIAVFYMFVSQSTSSMISFSAWVFSIVFLLIALWMLCEILKKDSGPRNMQDIAEVIREGSEGFFITQYGTIFKYAFVTAIGLFFMYMTREIPAESKLAKYFSSVQMALITSLSFGIGSVCSAIAGWAGIWVSVRANLRVAAASRKCYNDSIQICFRGGAFAAIINVALAIFGISTLYLIFEFYFWTQGVQNPPIEEIPVLMVGFGFGASFVAMFA